MIQLDYRDARPIYTQICDGIREQIAAGILRPEDRLPSVRELAASLTINPNTIQRSYRELESQGWIVTVPGKGCFVQGIPLGRGTEQQALLLEFDRLAHRLLALGLTPEELQARLTQGGDQHA